MTSECCCCNAEETIGAVCPSCTNAGQKVSLKTVNSLVEDSGLIRGSTFFICKDCECDVAYFSDEVTIDKDQVKVPIWYKKGANPKIMCYCSNITDRDIIAAVNDLGKVDCKGILAHAGATSICNCEMNNPTGKCCYRDVQTFIDSL